MRINHRCYDGGRGGFIADFRNATSQLRRGEVAGMAAPHHVVGVIGQPVRRWRQGQRGGSFGYALLSPSLAGRSGRGRCSVLLRRGRAWRFRGLLAFFTWPGTWLDFVHLGGVGEDVGELSVNCGWGFSAVGFQPRQLNSSVGQPQHEVRRFGHVSKLCTKSR